MFLLQLKNGTSAAAFFQQCDQLVQLLRSYLPPAWQCLSTAALPSMWPHPCQVSAGGHPCAHQFLCSAALHAGQQPGFDLEEAQRLRQMLAARHGDGTDLLLTVGGVMGNEDETLLTDSNKLETACSKVSCSATLLEHPD